MEDIERTEARLENIHTVEPILSALRTISLGRWRAAQAQQRNAQQYQKRLLILLPALVTRMRVPWSARRRAGMSTSHEKAIVLAVGSDRGLCGGFNLAILECTMRHLTEWKNAGRDMELFVLGSHLHGYLERRQYAIAWTDSLSPASLPPVSVAFELSRRWLTRYEAHDLDTVAVIYNAPRGPGRYETQTVRVIPPDMPPGAGGRVDAPWPAPIIETDPLALYAAIVEQWTATRLYELLLASAAAEHATRYQLMESAIQNTERLIDELTLSVQMARQQQITREMQELAAGAGMLGQ